MKAESFQEILAQFLEEKTPESPLKNETPSFTETPFFDWRAQVKRLKPKLNRVYPAPSQPQPKSPPRRPPVEEHLIPLAELKTEPRRTVERLIRLGASDLEMGLSRERLKKAHRNLAKVYHPDRGLWASTERFVEVQSLYEKLLKVVSELLSTDSARGSESASAADCPRRDAA